MSVAADQEADALRQNLIARGLMTPPPPGLNVAPITQNQPDLVTGKPTPNDKDPYSLKYNPVVENPDGSVSLRPELLQQGATASGLTQRLLDQQKSSEAYGRDDAASRAMQAADQARAAASMRGGNRSGNTAIMQRQSLRDQLMAQQDVSKQATANRYDINSKGAAQDMAAQNANVQSLGQSIEGVNKFNLEKYKTDAAKAAASDQASATRSSGGSAICTELKRRGLLSKQDYKDMHKLGVKSIFKRAPFTLWYLEHAPKAVAKARLKDADMSVENKLVHTVLDLYRVGQAKRAEHLYIQMTRGFVMQHTGVLLPDSLSRKTPKLHLLAIAKILLRKEVLEYVFFSLKLKFKTFKTKLKLHERIA
jgi:hypothetical protein